MTSVKIEPIYLIGKTTHNEVQKGDQFTIFIYLEYIHIN
ncbi:hypothetical protein RAMDARK_1280 [Rickettsia amblyommatis str. Darkwater]|nr:hypothetical protein RAMDARK_1280 [Rickettsia amblyommatis str. Darkwater]